MGERVLVVGPAFHGYAGSLATALRVLGHEVEVHPYDLYATASDKLRNKVHYELPERLGRAEGDRRRRQDLTARAIDALRAAQPDVVVVIRGDVLGADFWQAAEDLNARTVLWLYDELRRMKHDPDTLRRVGTLITYSPLDAESLRGSGVETHYIANAFDDTFEIRPEPVEAVLFIGARYPNRQRAVEQLVSAGVPMLAVGRDWSRHPFDRLRTWQLARPDVPARRDVSRGEAYNLMGGSLASLNIHTDQDGFTMRTFETGGAGGLQLIDRPDVSEFYDPGTEVAVFTSEEEMVDLARRAVVDRPWARSIGEAARRRTLAEHTFVHRARELEQVWG